MILHEWAVRCGCGTTLEQTTPESAQRVYDYFYRTSESGRNTHGLPTLLHRTVTAQDWEEVDVPPSA